MDCLLWIAMGVLVGPPLAPLGQLLVRPGLTSMCGEARRLGFYD